MIPLIALEEHYISEELCESADYLRHLRNSYPPPVHPKLLGIDQNRINNLNATFIKIQVISHIPFEAAAPEVRKANEGLRDAIKSYPSRLAGFALLSMKDPATAAAELEYSVRVLGFVGALIANHLEDGKFYDDASYNVVFAKAQELDVPIYLHPTFPSDAQSKALYEGPWDDRLRLALGGWCWGWHSTIGLHFLRLYAAGVFERFSKLKIILGHMGEMLPFMLDRIDPISVRWPGSESRTRSLRDVWNSNVWVTTSGMFSLAPMSCLLRTTQCAKIIYSVDYPLATNEDGLKFMNELQQSGLISQAEFESIAYKNAARLLRLNMD